MISRKSAALGLLAFVLAACGQAEETPAPPSTDAAIEPTTTQPHADASPQVPAPGPGTTRTTPVCLADIETVFTTTSLNSFVLQIEAALARAQAEHGVIPVEAAAEITASAIPASIPHEEINAENAIVRHRMVALLNVWRSRLSPETADYLHYGATTVDIYDSARMLQLRASVFLLIEDLQELEDALIDLAREYRDTPMIGRTLGQHALPITFGKKLSGYIGENRRHIDRLSDLLDRIERSVIMKGAVGSYVGLGDSAMAIEQSFARELGLEPPYLDDWHAARDVFAEYAGVLSLIARSQGRFGQEIFLLQGNDIGEVVERRPVTAVGSSTMPHKNNPSLSEALIQRARIIPRLAEIVADDMNNMFERDNTSRPNSMLGEISIDTEDMLSEARRLVERLDVNEARMRANLDRTGGWILAQRFVFALTPAVGREAAEEHLRVLAAEARSSGASLYTIAPSDPVIADALPSNEIERLLDPTSYTGLAAPQTDAVIAAALQARTSDPVNECQTP